MKIKKCRSCKSTKLQNAFTLGKQYLTGIFPENKKQSITKGHLSLVNCKNCSLLQLEHSFDVNEMYGENYGYMSSLNRSMISHLKLKAINLRKRYKFKNCYIWTRVGIETKSICIYS